ncbi:MAG: HAD family hydrolase [Paracoccaceae bacterium]
MISGVIFDKDGTLFDFRKSWGAWAAALLDQIGRDADHARTLGRAIGFDLESLAFDEGSPVIAGTPEDIAVPLLPHLPGETLTGLAARMNQLSAGAQMVPAVSLAEVLGGLRARGLKLGLATNDAEAPAHAHIGRAGVAGLFDYVAGFDSGHGGKPAPGMLLAFTDRFGLDPSQVVMVGDSLHDLEAGRAAGMRTAAVLTGIAGADVLSPHADVVLPDIGHLAAWIDGLSA